MIRTRFAPSPTGRLHLGHAYAAKVARDVAKAEGGEFLLRFEDIDTTRVREEFYQGIEEDLRWLGLDWDGVPLRQTQRLVAYEGTLRALEVQGVIYPCFCTRKEIEGEIARMAGAPHGPEGPLYPGTCKRLPAAERTAKLAGGLPFSWRLDATAAATTTGPLTFTDLRHGTLTVDPDLLGDVILARKDIGTSYHLAVTVDDAFQSITHVTRGEDLLASTHVHRLLQTLLGFPEPVYLHHRVLVDEHGKRLAKRHDSLSIRSLRGDGISAEGVMLRLAD
ncbi:tRNA glutamyl-Q(34) synthetase GluQRS [Luteolibacter sp. LG18]|uniref:tRNA glutamyl-Q(34) synthetase GluQRS n=1 Tax=Luteolibacter sp. LG18 TaxID=2819286 RepID=UPI002B2E6CE0|nr:tRNA glutamyl-Q(34) synthetase GluQRS [Luteolibacter sp. LG18]